MTEARVITLRRILAFSSATEIGTGIGLIVAPAIVVALLLRGEVSDLALLVARVLGITLLALGLACWPNRQEPGSAMPAWRGMLAYNGLVAVFLGYAGLVLHFAGPLLWPTVVLHGVVAVLLARKRGDLPGIAS
jgi:hypothetical protein